MRLCTSCLVVIVVLLTGFRGVVRAELTPEQAKETRALIEQFSAREFAKRQEAVEELIKVGLDVLPLVKKTLAETEDNEVKLRCGMVIKGISERHPIRPRKLPERLLDFGPDWRGGGGRREVLCYAVSPDMKSVATVLKRNEKWHVVHGGKKGPEYDMISVTPVFSPDSRRMVYGAERDGKRFIVCDGKEGPSYETVVFPIFSPDNKRLAYVAKRDGQIIYVCDDKEIPYRLIRDAVFSADSKHFAYIAENEAGRFVVADGVAGPPHDDAFSVLADAKVRYVAVNKGEVWQLEADWPPTGTQAGQQLTVRRVKSLGELPARRAGYERPIFGSPTADGIAYWFKGKGKTRVSLNGRELGVYDEVGWPGVTFSPDGRHAVYGARLGDQWLALRDGRAIARYEGFRANMKPTRMRRFSPYAQQGVSMMVFSPDSKHLAYCVNHARGGFIVCDGREGPEYDRVGYLRFSPDGKHLWYWAQRDGKWLLVCDGIEAGTDRTLSGPPVPWPWSSTGCCRYRFFENGHYWEAEVEWPKDLDWTNGLKPVKP